MFNFSLEMTEEEKEYRDTLDGHYREVIALQKKYGCGSEYEKLVFPQIKDYEHKCDLLTWARTGWEHLIHDKLGKHKESLLGKFIMHVDKKLSGGVRHQKIMFCKDLKRFHGKLKYKKTDNEVKQICDKCPTSLLKLCGIGNKHECGMWNSKLYKDAFDLPEA